MANFSRNSGAFGKEAKPQAATTGPVKAKTTGKKNKPVAAHTFEGGTGFAQNAKSELFLTAVSCFLGEPTFYESGDDRVDRIRDLTQKVTKKDPEWIEGFIGWLRNTANMRTVSVAVACEYVAAGGPNGRQVINAACARAEEPMEILGYWAHFYYNQPNTKFKKAPAIPQSIRKGLGDAVRRLWTEYSVMKYDTGSRSIGMANVLNLCHIAPADDKQAALFDYIVKRAYDKPVNVSALPQVQAQLALRNMEPKLRRKAFSVDLAREAGFTWEQASGWIGGELDAAFWESMIPNMPIFALLRNLRNFDQAGISEQMTDLVIGKLTNPDVIAKSRLFPYNIYTAYLHTNTDNWKRALGKTLDLTCPNIVGFEGDTLILVDKSSSMTHTGWGYAGKRQDSVAPCEKAALFGAALTKRSLQAGGNVTTVLFAGDSEVWNIDPSKSVIQTVAEGRSLMRGGATYLWKAIDQHFDNHDRVIVISDEQSHDSPTKTLDRIPFMHYHNVNGYPTVGIDGNQPGRFHYGGFSDATFKMMATLEQYSSNWPWLEDQS